jgi:hypothetical protein
MKHWPGLVYLAVGIAMGLIVGASVTGFAADDDEKTVESNTPGRYAIETGVFPGSETRNTYAYVFVLDTQTGTVYQKYFGSRGWDGPWHAVKQDEN